MEAVRLARAGVINSLMVEPLLAAHKPDTLLTRCAACLSLSVSHRYDAEAAAVHHAAKPDPTMAIDRIHELVYESYERDEKGRVIYPEGALNIKKFRSKMV